jgi:hypothetical protein
MGATTIQDPIAGENLVGIEPELLQQVDPGWLHRLDLFAGRALTAPALQSEQSYRAGRLAILGQCVTAGTVTGLELSADLTQADPVLQVAPGYGISATGEDVALLRTMRTTLGSIQVIDPQLGSVIAAFPDYVKNTSITTYAGVVLLQPITGQVSGASVDTSTGPIVVSGNLDASCDQDPEEYAFEDWQIVDGVRLVMVAWPASPATLAIPALSPAASWRNRLVYTVFQAEIGLAPDDQLPWNLLGVPVGLIGFDNTWKAQFVDRSAVVRSGGLPRSRYVLPADAGGAGEPLLIQPALAQARVLQLNEQINTMPTLTNFVPAFAQIPPCGVLPASAMDFNKQVGLWFPSNWTVQVGPVHQEEIETALLGTMTAEPLDVTQNESVEVLVPLPDALYDPEILLQETVDGAFQTAVNGATQELDGVLQHRKAIQNEANALSQVLTGAQQAPLYNVDAGLTAAETTARDAQIYTPAASQTFGTVQAGSSYASTDYQQLLAEAAKSPYTLAQDGNGNTLSTPLTLFSPDDLSDLAQNGLQHFIDRINAKLAKANDLLDLAFLTAQSDIYRFRQYVLGATDATALATSPIVANIATGDSAAATAANLGNYLSSVLAAKETTLTATTTTPSPTASAVQAATAAQPRLLMRNLAAPLRSPTLLTAPLQSPTTLTSQLAATRMGAAPIASSAAFTGAATVSATASAATAARLSAAAGSFTQLTPGTVSEPASPSDILQQSPVVGAQLNLRTLTIAQRLANPPSQDGIFYAVGNRLAILQLLADLEITIDDIQILVDEWTPPATASATPAPTTTVAGAPVRVIMPTLADFRINSGAVMQAVSAPSVNMNSDEADLFSTGIHVLEQQTSLLRAVEARIAQYNDFITLCGNALANIQSDLPQAQTLLTQLENDLAQARQDVAFTTALLNDEIQRVANLNAQRADSLNNVLVVVYARPRTLETDADVPSRQLVPGNVASPVPSCLQQSVAIPPELREIVALIREAPVTWLPSIQALLNNLERPSLLQEVAVDAQARAAMQLQLPLRVSSAATEPGVYAPAIASIYSANQQAFRTFQTQRAAAQPVAMLNQSWAGQVQAVQGVIAAGDLQSSNAVHAEVVSATSRLMQQISSVATCVYARAGQALPIDRLAWAEFLRGVGLSIQMQSLAVLPNWNTQDYVSRQRMQMLVDWLFQQIDTTNPDAVAYMSDVVRVAILLASDAPVDDVISGAVTLATTPKVGSVVSLTLPSERVAHGMYVQLYSSGVLAAQAVVTDLDSAGVRATVTQTYQAGVSLQANDVAHFTSQAPQAPAIRAFDS